MSPLFIKRAVESNAITIDLFHYFAILSKVMERVVHMQVYQYLFTNNLIYGRQSAYSPGDSTAYQLVSLVHFINEFFDNGQEICTVFLDFSQGI